jgi:hypothetical protein
MMMLSLKVSKIQPSVRLLRIYVSVLHANYVEFVHEVFLLLTFPSGS